MLLSTTTQDTDVVPLFRETPFADSASEASAIRGSARIPVADLTSIPLQSVGKLGTNLMPAVTRAIAAGVSLGTPLALVGFPELAAHVVRSIWPHIAQRLSARFASHASATPEGKATTRPLQPISPTGEHTPFAQESLGAEVIADAMPFSLLANWSRIALANLSQEVFDRLVYLARRPVGWRGPGSRALSSGSVREFLEFWMTVRDKAREPALALTAAGGLHAEWFKSSRRHLDLQFSGDGRIFFGLFDRGRLLEGVDDAKNLKELLNAHLSRPLKWHPRRSGQKQS